MSITHHHIPSLVFCWKLLKGTCAKPPTPFPNQMWFCSCNHHQFPVRIQLTHRQPVPLFPSPVSPKYHLGAQGHQVPPQPRPTGGCHSPTFMPRVTRRSTSSAQASWAGSLQSTGKMPRYRWAWRAVCSLRVMAMMGARGRYRDTRCADLQGKQPRWGSTHPAQPPERTPGNGLWEHSSTKVCLSATRAPKTPGGCDQFPQNPLTNQLDALLDFQLGNWADHHCLSPLVVTISSPPCLANAIRVFWPLNKPLLVSVAMSGWRDAIYSGLRKQALASQQGSLKVPCFEELPVFRVERAGASSTAQSMPRRKPSASQPP